ncbi:MAG: hypothetical protein ABJP80_07305 [Algibacter sp.]
MSKKIGFEIKESVSELQSLRKQINNSRLEKRLLFLILKNDSKFKTRENLAEYLSLSEATLRVWLWSKLYMKSGLDALLKISSGGANHTKITETLRKALELKLNDSACPLLGYNDAVN